MTRFYAIIARKTSIQPKNGSLEDVFLSKRVIVRFHVSFFCFFCNYRNVCVCVTSVCIYIYVYQFIACTIMLTFRSDSISELLRPVIRKGSPAILPAFGFSGHGYEFKASQLLLQFSRCWIKLYGCIYIYIFTDI